MVADQLLWPGTVGKPTGVVLSVTDITTRKLAEELEGTIFDKEYHRAKEEMVPTTFEAFYPTLKKWFEIHAYPYENGLSIYVSVISFIPPGYEKTRSKIFIATTDITEHKKAEEKLRKSKIA